MCIAYDCLSLISSSDEQCLPKQASMVSRMDPYLSPSATSSYAASQIYGSSPGGDSRMSAASLVGCKRGREEESALENVLDSAFDFDCDPLDVNCLVEVRDQSPLRYMVAESINLVAGTLA